MPAALWAKYGAITALKAAKPKPFFVWLSMGRVLLPVFQKIHRVKGVVCLTGGCLMVTAKPAKHLILPKLLKRLNCAANAKIFVENKYRKAYPKQIGSGYGST